MSWSVNAIGKSSAVLAAIEDQFEKQPVCMEPEESVRQAARLAIKAAVGGMPASSAVLVQASGSQSTKYDPQGKATAEFTNELNVKIHPQYGFVE